MVGNYVDFCGILWSFCGNLLVGFGILWYFCGYGCFCGIFVTTVTLYLLLPAVYTHSSCYLYLYFEGRGCFCFYCDYFVLVTGLVIYLYFYLLLLAISTSTHSSCYLYLYFEGAWQFLFLL